MTDTISFRTASDGFMPQCVAIISYSFNSNCIFYKFIRPWKSSSA